MSRPGEDEEMNELGMVKCTVCEQRFVDRSADQLKLDMEKHMKEDHPTELVAQEVCSFCGKRFTAPSAARAHQLVLNHEWEVHRNDPRPKLTKGGPRRRLRWTVTGEGLPLGSRKETWDMLMKVVALAERTGLRVEVTEVEEEER